VEESRQGPFNILGGICIEALGTKLDLYSRSLKYETLGKPARSVARAQRVAKGDVSNKEESLSLAQPRDKDEAVMKKILGVDLWRYILLFYFVL